jgi:hypothetical protein
MRTQQWQNRLNLLLGVWMMISPWALNFNTHRMLRLSMPEPAVWSTVLLGAALAVFAALAVYMPKLWEEALSVCLALGMMAAPWLFGFTGQLVPATNAIMVGMLATVFALWAMATEVEFQQWWDRHHWGH